MLLVVDQLDYFIFGTGRSMSASIKLYDRLLEKFPRAKLQLMK
jgi:hypothetical protein